MGADVDALDRVARRHQDLADAVRGVMRRVAAQRNDVGWRGSDASAWWTRTEEVMQLAGRVSLQHSSLARRIDAQARQQRRASLPPPGHSVTLLDRRGDGLVVQRIGAGDATTVVIVVPGVGTDLADAARLRSDVERVWEAVAVRSAGPAEKIAVESWLGYDPPDRVIGAVSGSAAAAGGRTLADHIDGLRSLGAQRVVLVGHSYGALTAAYASALRRPESPAVDELVLLGSPGLGLPLDDLRLSRSTGLWAATAVGDPISLVARRSFVHGSDPAALAQPLPTSLRGHGGYLSDPVLLDALAGVVTRRDARATVRP